MTRRFNGRAAIPGAAVQGLDPAIDKIEASTNFRKFI
jgi:hypothetical protein